MRDVFIPALTELASALKAGDQVDSAIEAVSCEHSVAPEALRNRALKAFGSLENYAQRKDPTDEYRVQSARRWRNFARALSMHKELALVRARYLRPQKRRQLYELFLEHGIRRVDLKGKATIIRENFDICEREFGGKR